MNPDFSPIEYIGPRGKKRGRSGHSRIGGWFLLLLALAIAICFVRPLLPSLQVQQTAPNVKNKENTIAQLREADTVSSRLAAAALARIESLAEETAFVEPAPLASADLILESYQDIGINLPDLVHRDMDRALRYYPLVKDDGSDSLLHRRVPNLQRFFSRWGQTLHTLYPEPELEFGDIIVWELPSSPLQPVNRVMGIVVPGPDQLRDKRWVVCEDGGRIEWTDEILRHEIVGHYRYAPVSDEVARLEMAGVAGP